MDRCYFFNPFSVEILRAVLARVIESYYENPRELLLFFYYPTDEYTRCLMAQDALRHADEIDCRDLLPGNHPQERILIFSPHNA